VAVEHAHQRERGWFAGVDEGARELARRDPVLAAMLELCGLPEIGRRRPRVAHFAALARAICYQQLAGRAASAIHGRFVELVGGRLTAEAVMAVPEDELRGAGLSAAKAASIRDLAKRTLDGTLRLDRISRLDDDEVVARLTQVRGIGEWTAQMFLMFQLGRLDVWPAGDYGVRNGWASLFGLDEVPAARELAALGEPYRPYRSLVAWYCWRAVDTATPG